MEAANVVRLLGGVAESRTLANRFGVTRLELNGAIDSGALIRVRRGCYALPDADAGRVAEAAWRGVVTCVTAAARAGLPILSPDPRIHLLIRAQRSQSGRNLSVPSSIAIHRADASQLAHHSLAHAIDRTAQCSTRLEQLVLVDAALNSGRLTPGALESFQYGSQRRRTWLLANSDARTDSPAETLARVALKSAGLSLEPQVRIPGVGRVDFVVEGRLIVEIDGRDYHSDPVAYLQDRRRDREAVARRWRVLRFAASEVFTDARVVALEVRSILDSLDGRRLPRRA